MDEETYNKEISDRERGKGRKGWRGRDIDRMSRTGTEKSDNNMKEAKFCVWIRKWENSSLREYIIIVDSFISTFGEARIIV